MLTSAASEPTRDSGWPLGVLRKHSQGPSDGTLAGLPLGAIAQGQSGDRGQRQGSCLALLGITLPQSRRMALLTTFHRKHHRLRTQCEGPGGTWTLRMTPKLTYLIPPPAHKGTQRTCVALHLSSASQLFQATLQEEPGTPFLINWGSICPLPLPASIGYLSHFSSHPLG